MNRYLLIKKEGLGADGKRLSARQSALALLEKGYWPLWEHTRNRCRIAEGDLVAVYLSGNGKCQVVATARISKIGPWNSAMGRTYPLILDGIPFSVLYLADVVIFENSVPVKERLDQLSFVNQNSPKWGVAFMGGTRALGEADFQVLTQMPVSRATPPILPKQGARS